MVKPYFQKVVNWTIKKTEYKWYISGDKDDLTSQSHTAMLIEKISNKLEVNNNHNKKV